MEGWERVRTLLQSRKFWALVLAIVAILAALSTGKIGTWEAVQAFVAALAAYSTGVAIEDAGTKIGARSNQPAQQDGAGPPKFIPSPQPSPWDGEGVKK